VMLFLETGFFATKAIATAARQPLLHASFKEHHI